MAEEPSDYDRIQDQRLDEIESLVSAEYEPPSGSQYSYPVASQGITQDQWQQMNLTVGDGTVITEDSEYSFRLVPHDTDSETNQRNTLILKVSDNTGRNEASLAGFYFRQTEDIELPFPAVTSTTTYYVTVTYDPRKFKTEPLRIEVYPNDLPRSAGQRHIVIRKVTRKPNQLLSQAEIASNTHYVSPSITAVGDSGLPDSTDVLYGTLGVVRSRTWQGEVLPGTGQIKESRGIHGWHDLLIGDWHYPSLMNSWINSSSDNQLRVRRTNLGLQIRGRIAKTATKTYQRLAILPSGLTPKGTPRFPVAAWPHTEHHHAQIDEDGSLRIMEKSGVDAPNYVNFDGIFIPFD